LAIFVVIILSGCFAQNSRENPYEGIIRLHIRANSNSADDLNLKLEVRNAVLDFLDGELDGIVDVSVAKGRISSRLRAVEGVASGVLLRARVGYRATASFTVTHFPRVEYQNGTLASGYYYALVVMLGEAGGNNWWCVIYPPLCFVVSGMQDGEGFRYRSFIWDRITGV